MATKLLTFEDFPTGTIFPLASKTLTEDEIVAFAQEFDPQPFHTDPASPQAEQVGGLIASGWHTCSLLMRMMCDSYLLRTASQGSSGLDEVRWLRPVRPGDTLSGTATVTSSRLSKSNPERGIIIFSYKIHNQNDEPVMEVSGSGMVDTADAVKARETAS